jgi:hypothetical protein
VTGRPTLYTPEKAERILADIACGRALRAVCRDTGMPPYGAVRQWITDDRHGFGARYRQVRSIDRAGRPCGYTVETADRIVYRLESNEALDAICREPDMPGASTVRQWVTENRDGFAARYRRARSIGRTRPGPPTTYSAEIAELILEQIGGGRPLTHVCRDPGMPRRSTVRHWAKQDHDGFASRLQVARWLCLDMMAEELVAISDERREEWVPCRMPDGSTELCLRLESVSRIELRVSVKGRLMAKVLAGNGGWWDAGTKSFDRSADDWFKGF